MSLSPQHFADERTVHSAGVAALTWIAWDTVVHLDAEINCIWRSAKLWVKIAYFFIRYAPIVQEGALKRLNTPKTLPGCRGWVWEELIFAEVLTLVVEILLVMRLYVLFNENKIILGLLLGLFVAEISVMVIMLALALPKMRFSINCLVSGTPGIFMAFWLSSLVFETFLFALTLVAFFRSVKKERGKHSIIYVFFRDGTWAFALIFIAMLLNTLMYKLEKNPLAGMGYLWCLSVLSFSGSHILLNIRRLGVPDNCSALSIPQSDTDNSQILPAGGILTTVIDPQSYIESTTSASGSSSYPSEAVTSITSKYSSQPAYILPQV